MIVVIQCAARKHAAGGYLRRKDGAKVKFVADPLGAPQGEEYAFARPDDISDSGITWREQLVRYNASPGDNQLGLLAASRLYMHPAYRLLEESVGPEKLFILSAGWGLIRADFLTPQYDITFSARAKQDAPWKFRRQSSDQYQDSCQLPEECVEPITFFGGKDYVPLFLRLTEGASARRTIFFNSVEPPHAPGCDLRKFQTRTKTNWHYECVRTFLTRA